MSGSNVVFSMGDATLTHSSYLIQSMLSNSRFNGNNFSFMQTTPIGCWLNCDIWSFLICVKYGNQSPKHVKVNGSKMFCLVGLCPLDCPGWEVSRVIKRNTLLRRKGGVRRDCTLMRGLRYKSIYILLCLICSHGLHSCLPHYSGLFTWQAKCDYKKKNKKIPTAWGGNWAEVEKDGWGVEAAGREG